MHIGHHRRFRTLALAVGCALATIVTLAPAATAAPTTGLVRGTVTGSDGAPLRNVSVTAVVDDPVFGRAITVAGPVTTAVDGSYRLRGDFDTGDQVLVQFGAAAATGGTSATGYADTCYLGKPWCFLGGTEVRVAAGASFTADVTLKQAAVITGRAVDALGRGVGGFPVSLWNNGVDFRADSFVFPNATTTTDVNGNYRFTQLPPYAFDECFGRGDDFFGGLEVVPGTPARDGYQSVCTGSGEKVRTTASRTTVRNVTLVGGGGAAGRIVDADGRPIAGATVTDGTPLPPATATTAADGTFRLGLLAAGPQAFVLVSADGYRPAYVTVDVRSFATTRVGQIVLQRTT